MSTTVIRGFEVLEYLATQRAQCSVRAMAAALGTSPSTLQRHLATLTDLGYARRSPRTGNYELTLKVAWIASQVLRTLELPEIALPYMEKLTAATNETTHLGLLDGKEIVFVAKVDGNQAIKMQSRVGSRGLVYSTSVGKAILAFLPRAERDALIGGLEFAPLTPRTTLTQSRLSRELSLTNTRGYSIDDEENEIGIRCVGAPIFDHNKRVVGAMSLSGWTVTMTRTRARSLGPRVRETALAVSKELGFRPENSA